MNEFSKALAGEFVLVFRSVEWSTSKHFCGHYSIVVLLVKCYQRFSIPRVDPGLSVGMKVFSPCASKGVRVCWTSISGSKALGCFSFFPPIRHFLKSGLVFAYIIERGSIWAGHEQFSWQDNDSRLVRMWRFLKSAKLIFSSPGTDLSFEASRLWGRGKSPYW